MLPWEGLRAGARLGDPDKGARRDSGPSGGVGGGRGAQPCLLEVSSTCQSSPLARAQPPPDPVASPPDGRQAQRGTETCPRSHSPGLRGGAFPEGRGCRKSSRKRRGAGGVPAGRGRCLGLPLPLPGQPLHLPQLTAGGRGGAALPAAGAGALEGQRRSGRRRAQALGQGRRRRGRRRQLPGRLGLRRAAVVHVVPGEQRRLRGSGGASG